MNQLDRTGQRIVGALIEKELSVPESYPLTEKALLAACNQKSNRDPEMGLEPFQIQGALNALMTADWVKTTTSSGGHAPRYSHRLETQFPVDDAEKAVLCELLVRGPQAPGALKPRVARLGFHADPSAIEAVLQRLASRAVALVERLEKRPRERDHRWRHRLGPMDPDHAAAGGVAGSAAPPALASAGAAAPPPTTSSSPPAGSELADLRYRVEQLEAEVARQRVELRRLRGD